MARKSATEATRASSPRCTDASREEGVREEGGSRTNITIYCTTLTLDDSNARRPRRRTPAGRRGVIARRCFARSRRGSRRGGSRSPRRRAPATARSRGRRRALARARRARLASRQFDASRSIAGENTSSIWSTSRPRAWPPSWTRGRAACARAHRPTPAGAAMASPLHLPPRAPGARLDRAAKRSPTSLARLSELPDIPRAPLRARRTSLARLSELPDSSRASQAPRHPSRASRHPSRGLSQATERGEDAPEGRPVRPRGRRGSRRPRVPRGAESSAAAVAAGAAEALSRASFRARRGVLRGGVSRDGGGGSAGGVGRAGVGGDGRARVGREGRFAKATLDASDASLDRGARERLRAIHDRVAGGGGGGGGGASRLAGRGTS